MFSFVPRAVTRYRRNNPYTHPLLFFVVDCTNSCLQFALVGAIAYGGYYSLNNWNATDVESDQVMKAVAEDSISPIQTAIVTASSTVTTEIIEILPVEPLERDEPSHLLDGKYAIRWVQSQPQDGYTIQFGASVNKGELIDFAYEHLTNGAVIYPFKRTSNDQTLYGVSSGLYTSVSSALRAIDNMPADAVVNDPWIRPISKLQKQVERNLLAEHTGR